MRPTGLSTAVSAASLVTRQPWIPAGFSMATARLPARPAGVSAATLTHSAVLGLLPVNTNAVLVVVPTESMY